MNSYKLTEVAKIINAKIIGNENAIISQIWIDSRKIVANNNGVFIALGGSQKNGHDYLEDAYNKGVRIFIVENNELPNFNNASFLLVENSLKSLQTLAKYHRERFKYPIIAITGSNGKTVLKELLSQVLPDYYAVVRSPKSYNSQIGVPLSVMKMTDNDTLGLFEVGISQPDEMQKLERIVQPNIGVLTNVGSAHSAFFENRKVHIQEKLKLFKNCAIIIIPNDNDIVQLAEKQFKSTEIITFGKTDKADIKLISTTKHEKGTNLTIGLESQEYKVQIPFDDEASISNTLSCIAVLNALKISLNKVLPKFKKIHGVEMRLEIKKGNNNTTIINDAFNSDLSSIPIALNALNQQSKQKKTLIISDVLENKLSNENLYNQVAEWVNAYPIQRVILVGKNILSFKHKFSHFFLGFSSTQDLLNKIDGINFNDEAILIKGARTFNLEKVSKKLELKTHDTVLEVNLQHLLENVNYFRSKLNPKTKLMCMVKAFGYGTGGFEVAEALSANGVDYLGVAYADEGAKIRQKGIETPIMVMNPELGSYEKIIKNNLEPEIYSLRVLNLFTEELIKQKINTSYPIHLKLNTGMNRLGFSEHQIHDLITELADNPYVKVVSIFSHLATSDIPEEKSFSEQQIELFDKMYSQIAFNLGYEPIRHILNSAGILNFPKHQSEMVRLGIGMYGVSPNKIDDKFLKNVVYFKTVISQISLLKEGETVGYGRSYKAKNSTKIATLPVGYADGIRRVLGNENGNVCINGQLVPIIGTICMDMIMVDVTYIDCKEGDEVVIFGDKPTLKDVAKQSGTITYEILTSISSRVKRVYLLE